MLPMLLQAFDAWIIAVSHGLRLLPCKIIFKRAYLTGVILGNEIDVLAYTQKIIFNSSSVLRHRLSKHVWRLKNHE